MVASLFNGALAVAAEAVLAVLNVLWGLLSGTAFTTPDVSTLPQVTAVAGKSMMVVNACFILAIVTAGIVTMTNGTVQSRYGVGELLPRLVIGWIAANFAVPICRNLVQVANALTEALTGDTVTSQSSMLRVQQITFDALNNPPSALLAVIIGLIVAVLTGMLLITWIVRLGVLIILVGISPLALACHATPFTDGAARLWWRSILATVATVVLQALALHTALSVFLNPDANAPQLGLPHDPTGTGNLLIVLCLLWAVVKIPGLMRRFVASGGARNAAGMILRMVLIQQLTSVLRLPLRRGGGRAAAGAGGAGRGGRPGGGSRGGGGRTWMPSTLGGGALSGGRAGSGGAGGRSLPSPAGAGPGRVGVAWPTGRPVRPYTTQQVASGVDAAWRSAPKRSTPTPASGPAPARSSRPPIRAAGVVPTPPPAGPRPVLPAGVNPATAMPQTQPVRQPVRPVPRRRVPSQWHRPTRT
ncbi:conjugal transfer protein TrbL family protein [Dactylosporangium sp. McL0621]|uniref:conjugal transfer protein TrbL family protein n=1 Tax=Dactylosporangium sp. McL0621 TaxID=3415678 RepID=UPI003CF89D2E